MRYNLKKQDGKRCILFGTLKGVNKDGRVFFQNVLIKNINNVQFEGKCEHLNVTKKHFKNKNVSEGQIIRFVGQVYRYIRQDGSKDYSVTPTDNIRRATEEEIAEYKKRFPSWQKKKLAKKKYKRPC